MNLNEILKNIEDKLNDHNFLIELSKKQLKNKGNLVYTGIEELDNLLGGIPKGKIIELIGPESAGKSTLSLSMIADTQCKGGTVALIDSEYAFDPEYAKSFGIDIEKLLLVKPKNYKQLFGISERLARAKVDLIVIDSIAMVNPIEMLSPQIKEICPALMNTRVVMINQIRSTLTRYNTTPGGKALKFYAHLRLYIKKIKTIKKYDKIVANRFCVTVLKSKRVKPFSEVEFNINVGWKKH